MAKIVWKVLMGIKYNIWALVIDWRHKNIVTNYNILFII